MLGIFPEDFRLLHVIPPWGRSRTCFNPQLILWVPSRTASDLEKSTPSPARWTTGQESADLVVTTQRAPAASGTAARRQTISCRGACGGPDRDSLTRSARNELSPDRHNRRRY